MSVSPRLTSTYRGAEEQEWEEWAWITGEAESGAELSCSQPSLGYLGCQGWLRTQLGVCLQYQSCSCPTLFLVQPGGNAKWIVDKSEEQEERRRM